MRKALIGAIVAAAGVLIFAAVSRDSLPAAPPISTWQAPPGAMTAVFASGTDYAVTASVFFDRSVEKTRGRVVLVHLWSGREIWSVDYRNRQCCLFPSVGFLPASRRVFASGDELLLVSLSGVTSRTLGLDGSTIDVAAAGEQILVGTLEGAVTALQANGEVWRTRHPDLLAVALSADGLAAVASRRAVAIYEAGSGRPVHQVPLAETRAVDMTFAPEALLVVALKTAAGDLQVLGIDTRTWDRRWTVALGATTWPALHMAGNVIVVSDFLGQMGAVISTSGTVQRRWTDRYRRVFIGGSPQGEIAVAIGSNIDVFTSAGRVRWRGVMPGVVLGVRMDGPWLAAMGTTTQDSLAPDRIWFARTDQVSALP